MPQTFQLRRGTTAEWEFANPVLQAGEMGYETSTNRIKIGTGVDPWSSLLYVESSADSVDWSNVDNKPAAFAPSPHASTHATGNSDAISPEDIGAAPSASPTFTGVITVSAGSGSAGSYLPGVAFSGDPNTGVQQIGGADNFSVVTGGKERVRVTPEGGVAIGYAGSATHRFGISGNVEGAGANVAFMMSPAVKSPVTSMYSIFSLPSVASGTSLSNFFHFWVGQSTYSGTVTNQYGLRVDSGFTGATNNYGVHLDIPNGTGRWNLYCAGGAPNAFIGRVGCNTVTPASTLEINGVTTIATGSGTTGSYLPSVVFSGDPNTGIQQIGGADTFSIVTGGDERVRIKPTGAVRFQPLTSDPASGEAGDVYYNSTANKLRVYNGTAWIDLH